MYEVALTKRAEKQLDKIPNVNYKSIVKHLIGLTENPRPTGCKKLVGFDYLYTIRVGIIV